MTFINTDVAEGEGVTALDITKIAQVLSLVRAEQPEVIINCAAHTNVDACEKQWDAAYRINALGPRNLSIAAEAVGAKMIHVSTDYVFELSCIRKKLPEEIRQVCRRSRNNCCKL